MNDEFLHRIRKTPPPQFLEGLKARLDRQPPPAPAPRRRWSFTRGLLAGLMLGGAAFAITAVSLTGGRPGPLRSFVSAPVQFVTRLLSGGNTDSERPEHGYRSHVVPLGPVWLPEHPGTGNGAHSETRSAPAPNVATTSASVSTAPGANGTAVGVPALENLRVLTPSTLYPIVAAAVNKLARGSLGLPPARLKIEVDPGNGDFARLCAPGGGSVDFVEIPRRITRDEYTRCNGPRSFGIVEVKVGYQALALARAQLYDPLKLSARDLFLALARRIPDPNRPGSLLDNPNTTWNQVDPALPYDRIQVLGPAVGSTPAKLVAKLLLRPGCSTYPWIAALWESDPERYEEICGSLREDGVYQPSGPSGSLADFLSTNPTASGVVSLNDFRMSHNGLVLNPIDGVEPAPASIANGTYPAARPLYLYTVGEGGPVENQVFLAFVRYNMAVKDLYGRDPDGWGFVVLDEAEADASLASVQQRRILKF